MIFNKRFLLGIGLVASFIPGTLAAHISSHDSNFDFFEEEPYIPGPCDRPLNVIVTGMFGAGKLSLINNFYDLYNITNDHDKSLVAIQSGDIKSVTLQCNIYNCESNKDFKHSPLNLMDTPGFEMESRDFDNAKTIANSSLHSFGRENCIDAIYIVIKHERQKASSTTNLVNQIQMILDPKIYDRVVFIITNRENVAVGDREKEWSRIK
jgi:predicted GTPase